MSEEQRLTFMASGTSDTMLDLSAALTSVNRKQYHQTKSDGTPLCYKATVTFVETDDPADSSTAADRLSVQTAPNTWTTRNAVKKMHAAWRKQLKDAGIKMRDVGTYSKRLRLPLSAAGSQSGTGAMAGNWTPQQWDVKDGTLFEAFETYKTKDGVTVSYDLAGEYTRVAIPDEAGGESVEMNLALLGDSEAVGAGSYFGVIYEYLSSRGGMIDEPSSSQQLPDPDNLMQTMFSSTQPSTDEVVEALEDFQDYRPYNDGELDSSVSPITDSSLAKRATYWGILAPQNPYAATNNVTSVTVDAPLGLINLEGDQNNKTVVDVTVHAIYEM